MSVSASEGEDVNADAVPGEGAVDADADAEGAAGETELAGAGGCVRTLVARAAGDRLSERGRDLPATVPGRLLLCQLALLAANQPGSNRGYGCSARSGSGPAPGPHSWLAAHLYLAGCGSDSGSRLGWPE